MQVRDVMTTDVTTVAPDDTLKDAARRLVAGGISGAPVCDAAGRVLGVVSEADVVEAERPHHGRRRRPVPVLVVDAMTEPAVAADPSTPVEVAAELMARHRVKRLPVVHDGRLVGIVSRSDLMRAFARGDGELRREIVEDVLADRLWLTPPSISCSVAQGVVTLSGRLHRRSLVAIVDDAVRRVPGVVDVDTTRLSWAVDV